MAQVIPDLARKISWKYAKFFSYFIKGTYLNGLILDYRPSCSSSTHVTKKPKIFSNQRGKAPCTPKKIIKYLKYSNCQIIVWNERLGHRRSRRRRSGTRSRSRNRRATPTAVNFRLFYAYPHSNTTVASHQKSG